VYESMVVSFCLELGPMHQRSVIFLNNNNYYSCFNRTRLLSELCFNLALGYMFFVKHRIHIV